MSKATFFFYDLETSGFNPREARIMQFGGQRTDLDLKPIGEPVNLLITLSDDVLPEPDAILVTGITPQATRADGITEAEFLKIFENEIATPGTIFTGFNTVRFDDEFMRFLHYRNFYDPYEWQWKEDRGRWDILDVVRMTRALRPDGIKWPVDTTGKATNRLELLTSLNKLEHGNAHDALSDVNATIAVARMIYNKQTKLFEYLLSIRSKQKVAELIDTGQPFVYTSGKYPSEYEKTSIAVKLANHPKKQGALVFDLRYDPSQYEKLKAAELVELWKYKKDDPTPRLPVKTLQYNRCPAVAPLGVLDESSQKRLQLDMSAIKKHFKTLETAKQFKSELLRAVELMNQEQQTQLVASEQFVDAQLYDGFFPETDKTVMRAVRAAEPDDISGFADQIHDQRLKALLPLYKARNFPKLLSDEERTVWEAFREAKLTKGEQKSRIYRYFARLQELANQPHLTGEQRFLLEELQLYGESLVAL